VVLSVTLTINGGSNTGRLSGKVSSPNKMSGTVTFVLDGGSLPKRALHWLAIAVDRGFINYPFLGRHDPFIARLRSQPRFQKLLETVRDRWEKFEP
jgi:hypothetical protein